jgi:hypothetical protein
MEKQSQLSHRFLINSDIAIHSSFLLQEQFVALGTNFSSPSSNKSKTLVIYILKQHYLICFKAGTVVSDRL